jgi:nucleoside-diphosphate-sugar epimerase
VAGTVVVTGAQGLIGRAVVRELRARNVAVIATDVEVEDGVLRLDVRDFDAVRRVLAEHSAEAVIHLAAWIGVRTEADPHAGTAVNVLGTSNVLEAARLEGVRRVVLASSIMRQAGRGLPHSGGDHPGPRNLYAAHKLVMEFEAERYRALFGLDSVVVAVSATLGARAGGSSPERSPHVYMVEQARAGTTIDVPCAPDWSLPLRRTEMVAAIFVGAALAEDCGHFYHSGGRYTSMAELAREIEAQSGCTIRFGGGDWPSLPEVDGRAAERDFAVLPEDLRTMVARALAERGTSGAVFAVASVPPT